jgi:hypothetical protein
MHAGGVAGLASAPGSSPLVSLREAMRAAFPGLPPMPVVAVYAALVSFTFVLMWLGLDGFRKRGLT